MAGVLLSVERLIHDVGRAAVLPGSAHAVSARRLAAVVLTAGPVYGALMGSYGVGSPGRAPMVAYAAAKVPLLLFATTVVCLPAFFVLNTVAGLRDDFRSALRAVLAGQAALSLALASLGPLTRFAYSCGVGHRGALLLNALMFTAATATGQVVMRRAYAPLVARAPRHRAVLWAWVALYAFVGMQMGWMLRPFVGTPNLPVSFFRDEPFSNAYVVIARLIFGG